MAVALWLSAWSWSGLHFPNVRFQRMAVPLGKAVKAVAFRRAGKSGTISILCGEGFGPAQVGIMMSGFLECDQVIVLLQGVRQDGSEPFLIKGFNVDGKDL